MKTNGKDKCPRAKEPRKIGWPARLVRWLWSHISCWNCGKFGGWHDCLVERQPDGLHDRWMICSHCAGKPFSELQRELYPPNQ
jgi:hypothetical protein